MVTPAKGAVVTPAEAPPLAMLRNPGERRTPVLPEAAALPELLQEAERSSSLHSQVGQGCALSAKHLHFPILTNRNDSH